MRLIEKYIQVVLAGLNTAKPVDFSQAPTVKLPTGTTVNGSPISGGSSFPITSTSATANAIGPNGSTNPTFNVDASVASAATGLNVQGQAAGGGLKVGVLSSGTNEALSLDGKGTGALNLNTSSTTSGLVTIGNTTALGGVQINGPSTITSALATALNVGPAGATNPVFQVNASTASQISGLQVTGGGTGAGVKLSAISSATNEDIYVSGKSAGSVYLGANSTGGVLIQQAPVVLRSDSAATAGGKLGIQIGGVSIASIYIGSGAPTVSAAQGSVYFRTDGSSTSTRMYINTNGSTTWTNVTTAA